MSRLWRVLGLLAALALFAPTGLTAQQDAQMRAAAPDPLTAPQPDAPPDIATAPEQASARDGAMAINLAGVNDWSVQQPFLNVMKTARPWIGHIAGRWGGMEHGALADAGYLDENGWPLAIPRELGSIGTVILTDLPEQAVSLAGRYRLRFDGDGVVEVSGRAQNVRYGGNEVSFDFAPGPGPVEIRIQRTDRTGTGDHVRNITVVRSDRVDDFDAGAIFNPDWLARIAGFDLLRFMDWMATNNSDQSDWAGRPKPGDYTWALKGVPLEVMLELANRLGVDAWFTMPHRGGDDYMIRFANMTRDRLAPDRSVYVEYSNEVWNWQFTQAQWADEQARARWDARDAWMQFYGMRAAQIAAIWTGMFGAQADGRLVNVISSQTGWPGLEQMVLDAPLWQAEGNPAPAKFFDAYAVTGYFGGIIGTEERAGMVKGWLADSLRAAESDADAKGLRGAARADHVTAHRHDVAIAKAARELHDGSISGDPADTLADLLGRTLPYHAQVAREHGLNLIMYEGGSHVVGIGAMVDDAALTDFLIDLNYSAEMGALYRDLIVGWFDLGGVMFNAYADVYRPTKWGSWGALRFLSDENPRWDALVAFR